MSRTALSCVERAKREVLPLDLALYHAVREYPGGAAAIAATTGRNATTLQHKLSPTHPGHVVNIQEFGEILELTKDRRILDAVHALVGDTIWQELSCAYTEDMPETLTMGIAVFFRQVADLSETWARNIGDGKVDDAIRPATDMVAKGITKVAHTLTSLSDGSQSVVLGITAAGAAFMALKTLLSGFKVARGLVNIGRGARLARGGDRVGAGGELKTGIKPVDAGL